MDKGHNFWRRLNVVGMLVGGVRFLAFFLAYRSARQAEAMNRCVNRTQEALGVIAQARLERAWLQTECWIYRSSRRPDVPPRFPSDLGQKFEETVRQFGRYWLLVSQMPPNSAFIAKQTGGLR
jgi:hypothetical protein